MSNTKLSKAEILSKNLTQSGYGGDYDTILKMLNKLNDDEIEMLAYNSYRTSEKLGEDAFDAHFIYED